MNTSATPRIVVGVSGSPASLRAVEEAARAAQSRALPLHLAHVFNWLPDATGDPSAARSMLRQAAVAAVRIAPALDITTELVEGRPLTGLLRLSRRAALTVIGDGNLNDLTCMPRDAIAVQLTARGFGSVVVTRAWPVPDGPVLVGVDGSAAAEPVLDFAFDAAAHRRQGLLVVHVLESGDRTDALDQMVASRALASGVDARLRVLDGDPTTVMARQSHEASLIVVGARGRSPYHGLLGSVTQTLLHHGPASVAVIRGAVPESRRPARSDATPRRRAIVCARVPEAAAGTREATPV
ncbi:universal stress protein [Actinoplanes derwentensis]|uniref:Nucleotide-binding universal stress protein, UspA family n=1 Tax=Actinoplanes derwentensis TaxID=113562 RepID=A0A1H2B7B8_9ACTN|nr:universal stress protein [Actinoplanes derwentensis]GID86420.1 universal stress protein [Actinoplanes derwentensis]SDT53952.1 Nucleotide-binding universal stress protein, UspA family [Actinoplanes derwentensis]